jgi:xanthine dehydrogenase iron-sulfur cluster and FAD-binding subunit A
MTVAPPVIREAVRFRVNGTEVEVRAPGGRRLLDVLRVDLGLTGTKEGCGEGECGACSVLLDGVLVDSCLVPLAQVDGADLVTVEGLADGDRLDPLQQAFLEAGGTQCGMCAPAMLLAARALLDGGGPVDEHRIREAIAGNLCRCTGYTKVIEAIELAAAARGGGRNDDPGRPTDRRAAETAGANRGSMPARGVTVIEAPDAAGPRVTRPSSLFDALARLAADHSLRPIAGGTDVMVELAAGAASAERPLLDIRGLDELRGVEVDRNTLVLGALTTFAELRASPIVRGALPVLAEAAASVGAAQVRHRGTIGGNCVTASPAGDLLPVLLATDAWLEVAGVHGRRLVAADAFWTGYRRTALAPGELLVGVRIPLVPGRRVRFRKVGTRQAQAIAKVVLAVAWQGGDPGPGGGRDDGHRAWHDVRVALGSVAERPIRAARTEAVVEGRVAGPAVADEAAATVRGAVRPIDDVRSTAAYRRAVTARILRRLILDAAG